MKKKESGHRHPTVAGNKPLTIPDVRKGRELAFRLLQFWNVPPFRTVWFMVLRHRFSPDSVWLRYERLSMRRETILATQAEGRRSRFKA